MRQFRLFAIQPEVRFIAKQNSLMKIGNNGNLVLGPFDESTPCLMIVWMNCQTKLRINHLTVVKSVAILETPWVARYHLIHGLVPVRSPGIWDHQWSNVHLPPSQGQDSRILGCPRPDVMALLSLRREHGESGPTGPISDAAIVLIPTERLLWGCVTIR
ncbi:alpha-2 adrenergic receptor [Trichonephila clavipes]|nr:alpha-2 adrenergic receptor [Trichonephila clavipes]